MCVVARVQTVSLDANQRPMQSPLLVNPLIRARIARVNLVEVPRPPREQWPRTVDITFCFALPFSLFVVFHYLEMLSRLPKPTYHHFLFYDILTHLKLPPHAIAS